MSISMSIGYFTIIWLSLLSPCSGVNCPVASFIRWAGVFNNPAPDCLGLQNWWIDSHIFIYSSSCTFILYFFFLPSIFPFFLPSVHPSFLFSVRPSVQSFIHPFSFQLRRISLLTYCSVKTTSLFLVAYWLIWHTLFKNFSSSSHRDSSKPLQR